MTRNVVDPNRNLVDVTTLIARVVHEAPTDGHQVTLTTTRPVVANVDAAQVERIVENLLTNALRYTPEGTRIWLSVVEQDEGVLLVVEDDGPGIEPELREAIFEPFRQGSETVEHSPGVGIGLSLVARFAAMHGGRAWVEERPGGGASFRIYLPAEVERPLATGGGRAGGRSRGGRGAPHVPSVDDGREAVVARFAETPPPA
jgi:signal transduction histidine kinase